MIEKIEWKGILLALIMRRGLIPEVTTFYTPKDNSIQMGIITHPRGYEEKPHIHKRLRKVIYDVQETLEIASGKVEISFYSDKGQKVDTTILNEGDTILLIAGGHAVKALEDFKGIKVKQGPYVSLEEDKAFLETE